MKRKSIISKYLSETGKRGGSVTSEAKAEASRLNGKLGGRPSKRNAPRETFDLQRSIARYQRIRLLQGSIDTILAADGEALTRLERVALQKILLTISKVEKRWSIAVEEHQLETAQTGL